MGFDTLFPHFAEQWEGLKDMAFATQGRLATGTRHGILAALALLGFAALVPSAHAQGLINFDLRLNNGDVYGPGAAVFGTETSTWNYRSRLNSASSLALTNDTGAATGVTVSYTRNSSSGFNSITGTFAALGVSSIDTDAVTFTGLTPGGAYDLVIFSGWDGQPSFTVDGVTKTTTQNLDWSSLTEGTQYVSFQTIADGSGALSFAPQTNPTGSLTGSLVGASLWSAFQLRSAISSSAPEPGTLALLALGTVGGVVARRRK